MNQSLKDARILIIDDQESNLVLIEKILKKHGYIEYKSLSDPRRVIPTVQEWMPDLILLDLMMPYIDGFELMDALKRLIPDEDYLPILVLTADVDSTVKRRALSSGAMDFLTKPFDVSEVILRVGNLLFIRFLYHKLRDENLTLEEKVLLRTSELEQSEKRNRAILEAIPDMMFITDGAGVFLDFHVNNLVDLYIMPENFLRKSISKVLPPDLASAILERINLVSTTGNSCSYEYSLMKEGVQDSYEARMVSCGEQKVMTVVRNITEKKIAEKKIKRQIEYLTAINEIDLIILGSMELRSALRLVLTQVLDYLKVDAAVVLTLDQQTMAFEYATCLGIPENEIEQLQLPIATSFARRAVSENRVIFASDLSQNAEKFTLKGELSGEGFVSSVVEPLTAKGNTIGVLQVFNRSKIEEDRDWIICFEGLGNQIAIAIDSANTLADLKRSNTDLIQSYDDTIEGWSRGMDLRDKETEGHTLRVTEMTLLLAKEYGMEKSDLVNVRRGALLHDMGKLGIPDSILLKPGKLTDEEWVIMRKHPQFALDMLMPIAYLRPALDIPYSHHEKWDGSGYPQGLKEKQIPLTARMFAVVDVWDALRSDRPYREAWPEEKVIEHIKAGSGSHFDPEVVEIFMKIINKGGGIISTAHRLGHCAIAEGVEQEVQKQYLLAHGCDKIQGYLVSRPLDEEAAVELLAKQESFDNSCHLNDRQCQKDGESFER